ncbi:unnamed protein product [Didymodactylos carnosus]|uniref:DUF4403 family protein n=1 Tax=Didymodactylos carnosus TaxID=1234261 RepID=A0A8S2GJP2_9BILA|nr:unnamed protein product [Didymodactylos carnosus]CAF3525931.1 unnamed protein product [Didymodactylos carnosus]
MKISLPATMLGISVVTVMAACKTNDKTITSPTSLPDALTVSADNWFKFVENIEQVNVELGTEIVADLKYTSVLRSLSPDLAVVLIEDQITHVKITPSTVFGEVNLTITIKEETGEKRTARLADFPTLTTAIKLNSTVVPNELTDQRIGFEVDYRKLSANRDFSIKLSISDTLPKEINVQANNWFAFITESRKIEMAVASQSNQAGTISTDYVKLLLTLSPQLANLDPNIAIYPDMSAGASFGTVNLRLNTENQGGNNDNAPVIAVNVESISAAFITFNTYNFSPKLAIDKSLWTSTLISEFSQPNNFYPTLARLGGFPALPSEVRLTAFPVTIDSKNLGFLLDYSYLAGNIVITMEIELTEPNVAVETLQQ